MKENYIKKILFPIIMIGKVTTHTICLDISIVQFLESYETHVLYSESK